MKTINAEDIFKTILEDPEEDFDPDTALAAHNKAICVTGDTVSIVSMNPAVKGAAKREKQKDDHKEISP